MASHRGFGQCRRRAWPSTTANSSPSNRPPIGVLRQRVRAAARARPPGTDRRHSCPKRVVDVVQAVEIDEGKRDGTSARVRAASAASISSIILRWLGSRVSMSSCASVHARFSLWPRSRDRAADLPHRKPGKTDQAEPCHREQRLEPLQRRGHRAFRLPTEPADDAALRIDHRLHLAAAAGGLGLEAQVLQAGGALQAPDHSRDPASRCRRRRHGFPGRRASSAPRRSRRLAVVGLTDQHVADDGAEQRDADDEQRERRDQPWRDHPAAWRRQRQGSKAHD